jgi:hypothetical protein
VKSNLTGASSRQGALFEPDLVGTPKPFGEVVDGGGVRRSDART